MAKHQGAAYWFGEDWQKEVSRKSLETLFGSFCFVFWKVKETRRGEVSNQGSKMIEKPAGNPRVMPLTPQISARHVATLRVAPPLRIKFGAKPQESQTTQENFSSSMVLMTRHRRPQNLGGNRWEWRDYISGRSQHSWQGHSEWRRNKSSLTRTGRSFNIANQWLGQLRNQQSRPLEPNKSSIIGLKALQERGINTLTVSSQTHIYKVLTLAA